MQEDFFIGKHICDVIDMNIPIDIILIERTGSAIFHDTFYDPKTKLFKHFALPDISIRRLWPKIKRQFSDKDALNFRYRNALDANDINKDITIEEFENPKTRFKGGRPNIFSYVILYDDTVLYGKTIDSCARDLVMLGYSPEKIYFYDYTIKKWSKNQN